MRECMRSNFKRVYPASVSIWTSHAGVFATCMLLTSVLEPYQHRFATERLFFFYSMSDIDVHFETSGLPISFANIP